MNINEIRKSFLKYFRGKNHILVPSSSIIPKDDNSILFTNSGMVQFKDIFTGKKVSKYSKVVSCQMCLRAGGKHNDLENIGHNGRHHTLFEMLGNFSFGDYFKEKAIEYAWEYLTKELYISPDRLRITTYEKDIESKNIWLNHIGIKKNHLEEKSKTENFWSMDLVGPCGPCSEIFYDRGSHINNKDERFIEIWNLVFMQFNKKSDGSLSRITTPCIDTGMGLERITAVLGNKDSNYEIDIFNKLSNGVKHILKKKKIPEISSINVIIDHIRSSCFLIHEGVTPGNEGRSYVLRRIIRRAMLHGNKIGFNDIFFHKLVPLFIDTMSSNYPNLIKNIEIIKNVIKEEEEKFFLNLNRGVKIIEKEIETSKKLKKLSGSQIFKLYDTFGLPLDITLDIAKTNQFSYDIKNFNILLDNHKKLSREKKQNKKDNIYYLDGKNKTIFEGYDKEKTESNVLDIYIKDKKILSTAGISSNKKYSIVLDRTPFYAESGGQVGDTGFIKSNNFSFKVQETKKINKIFIHIGILEKGEVKKGDKVIAEINKTDRKLIKANHTATHILHASLKILINKNIQQKGSYLDREKLRFDFNYDNKLHQNDIETIEHFINQKINAGLKVINKNMKLSDVKKLNIKTLFYEKYEENVRVLFIGDDNFSVELCGGTHVSNTNEIKLFKIIKETSLGIGMKRIEAITGETALKWLDKKAKIVDNILMYLNCKENELNNKIKRFLDENKKLNKYNNDLYLQLEYEKIKNKKKLIINNNGDVLILHSTNNTSNGTIKSLFNMITQNHKNYNIIIINKFFHGKYSIVLKLQKHLKKLDTIRNIIHCITDEEIKINLTDENIIKMYGSNFSSIYINEKNLINTFKKEIIKTEKIQINKNV